MNWTVIGIGFVIALVYALYIIGSARGMWNSGRCPHCDTPWWRREWTDTRTRHYFCTGGHDITITFPFIYRGGITSKKKKRGNQ